MITIDVYEIIHDVEWFDRSMEVEDDKCVFGTSPNGKYVFKSREETVKMLTDKMDEVNDGTPVHMLANYVASVYGISNPDIINEAVSKWTHD